MKGSKTGLFYGDAEGQYLAILQEELIPWRSNEDAADTPSMDWIRNFSHIDLVDEETGQRKIILMTSDSMTPAKGHWYGIRYDGLGRTMPELRNLSLEWGKKGISDTNTVGIPNLDGIAVQQMQEDGIRASNAPLGAAPWTFKNIDITLVDQIALTSGEGDFLDQLPDCRWNLH